MQEFIQRLLEQEELLGRAKSERREPGEPLVYRNGYGKPRKLALSNGTITVQRPWVRGLEERFESWLLPLFKRCTEEVAGMLPELYLHGLALGDFESALRGLLGKGAPFRLGAATYERLETLQARGQCSALIWKLLRIAEKTFRRLNAPHLLAAVARVRSMWTGSLSRLTPRGSPPDAYCTPVDGTSRSTSTRTLG